MGEIKHKLYGAILGDLAGQPYEFPVMKHFPERINLFNPDSVITDDTLMTLATAESILTGKDIGESLKSMGCRYYGDHYGKGFKAWLKSAPHVRGESWGNGCLMRISPYFYAFEKSPERNMFLIDNCLTSHCHKRSINAVQRLSYLYDDYYSESIHGETRRFDDNFKFTKFEVRSSETIDFVEDVVDSNDIMERLLGEVISYVVGCGGDTDTNASIVAEIHNYHENSITPEMSEYVESKLDNYLLDILKEFNKKF